ncbi:MAG: hypothetical protein ABL971_07900 [Vicinamibacterales bacterium]
MLNALDLRAWQQGLQHLSAGLSAAESVGETRTDWIGAVDQNLA